MHESTELKSDRARASEHAIVIERKMSALARDVMRVLPRIGGQLTEKISLIFPSAGSTLTSPLEVAMLPSPQEMCRLLVLRAPHATADFFEGEIRLRDLPAAKTGVMLVGRFTIPHDLNREHLHEGDVRRIAEDNVIRIFDSLLLEIQAALAGMRRSPRSPDRGS